MRGISQILLIHDGWLNIDGASGSLSSILAHYRFPERIFVGSSEGVDALEQGPGAGSQRPPTTGSTRPKHADPAPPGLPESNMQQNTPF